MRAMVPRLSGAAALLRPQLGAGGVVASLTVALSAARFAAPRLPGGQVYPDFTASEITLLGVSKDAEFTLFFLFLAAFAVAALAVNLVLAGRRGDRAAASGDRLLLLAATPAFWWLGTVLVEAQPLWWLVHLAALFVALALAGLAATKRFAEPGVPALAVGAAAAAPLAVAALVALATFAGRALHLGTGQVAQLPPLLLAAAGGLGLAAALAVVLRGGPAEDAYARLRRLLLGLQAPLPLLVCAMLPPLWRVDGALAAGMPVRWPLYALLAVMAGVAWWGMARQARRAGEGVGGLFSAWALAALVVAFALPDPGVPALPTDDYHFGENILPWQQMRDFAKLPFLGLNLVHGFIQIVPGILADLFFDGTVGAFWSALTVHIGLFAAAFYLCMARLVGPLAALFIAVSVPFGNVANPAYYGENYVLVLVPAALCVLALPSLLARPLAWLWTYTAFALFVLVYRNTYGGALALAGLPVALWMMWVQGRRDLRTLLLHLGAGAAALALLMLLTPVGPSFLGWLRYMAVNAAVNATAWGTPGLDAPSIANGTRTGGSGLLSSPVAWQILRFAWIGLLCAAAVAAWREAVAGERRRPGVLVICAMLVVYLIVLYPYSLGRLAMPSWSITGKISIVLATTIVPVLALLLFRARAVPALAVASVVFGATMSPLPDLPALLKAPFATVPAAPADVERKAALAGLGLPAMGAARLEPAHLDRLLRLNNVVSGTLAPHETFWDLTSRNAQYVYLDRPVPVAESAITNTVGTPAQERAREELLRAPPPLIFADAPMLAVAPISVRSNLLYRHAVLNHVPVGINSLRFLVTPDLARRLAELRGRTTVAAAAVNEPGWDRGIATSGPAGFRVANPFDSVGLAPGARVVFAGSGPRTVRAAFGTRVVVDGPPLDPARDGAPNPIRVERQIDGPAARPGDRLDLLDASFAAPDLRHIPAAWGRSWKSLARRLQPLADLPGRRPLDAGVAIAVPGVDGRDAGLLGFTFACERGDGPPPVLRLSWTGDSAAAEGASVRFAAPDGRLLVPADAQPRWLFAGPLREIRLELADPRSCRSVRVTEAALYRQTVAIPPTAAELASLGESW